MTAISETRESTSLWGRFCIWITSTKNHLYIEWFSVLMIPTLLTTTSVFIIAFIAAPPVDIDGICDPVTLAKLPDPGSESECRAINSIFKTPVHGPGFEPNTL
jgi:hypothetical protein